MKKVAFTTTIPQEYIWAAGMVPVDLNNLFITGNSDELIKLGEEHGIPRNTCSWIKGLMGAVVAHHEDLEAVIAVSEGDCSNNHGLVNLYKYYFPELKVISFAYPNDRDPKKLRYELDKLGEFLGVSYEQAMAEKKKLDIVRQNISSLDELHYQNNNLPAKEVQQIMVSSSDFCSDVKLYASKVEDLIEKTKYLHPSESTLNIGYVGVPTIIDDLFSYLEDELAVKVTYFEVERDFAMIGSSQGLVEQYQLFKYPYDLQSRVDDMKKQISKRKLKGIIHYAQSFCHRQLDDVIIKESLGVPVLTVEGDAPGALDMRTKIRIECFIERLRDNA